MVPELENEKNGQNLDKKLKFEKTIFQQNGYSNSKKPCSYDSKEF